MRLPWYVALDRWVRRNPSTFRTGKILLAITAMFVVAPVAMLMPLVVGALAHALTFVLVVITVEFAEDALEHYADKWREEH